MRKKGYRSFIIGVISVILITICLPLTSFAAESTHISVPVTVTLDGATPIYMEDFHISLTADDPAYPMPDGSKDGVYTLTIPGAATRNFPDISYSRPGIYTYTIQQKIGNNNLCTYSNALYTLTVYITNMEDGSGLESMVIAHVKGSSEKTAKVLFQNSYDAPPTDLAVRKVWVDNGKKRPSYIHVTLYNGTDVIETIRLDASNQWTYTWPSLAGDGKWNIAETSVPNGYTVSYKTVDHVITITNTASLIQTGQLIWPIYLLSSLGVLFIVSGIYAIAKKRKKEHAEK